MTEFKPSNFNLWIGNLSYHFRWISGFLPHSWMQPHILLTPWFRCEPSTPNPKLGFGALNPKLRLLL